MCKDQIYSPSPRCMGSWPNKLNTIKFVESGSKNQALTSWTTANTELNDKQTQIKDFDINRLSIQGGNLV